MFVRFLHMQVKTGLKDALIRVYDREIIPALQETEGCRYATLIKGSQYENEFVSMTLWRTKEAAEAYTRSETFERLLDRVQPYLEDSSEWKMQLSKDLTLEYQPVPDQPQIETYEVIQDTSGDSELNSLPSSMHLRLVSARIKPHKLDELRSLYKSEVIPTLRKVKGCRFVCLIENVRETSEAFSLTIWNSEEDALEYERSGLFELLVRKLEHTFSDLYQWKVKLKRSQNDNVITSDDMTVKHYSVVTGKNFS